MEQESGTRRWELARAVVRDAAWRTVTAVLALASFFALGAVFDNELAAAVAALAIWLAP